MHRDLWGCNVQGKENFQRNNPRSAEKQKAWERERDRAIIMALVLLMLEENPDEILISALMYIIS